MRINKWIATVLALCMVLSMMPIFAVECAASDDDWRAWSQSDSRWGSIRLGSSYLTVASHGCLVTAVTKLIIQAGLKDADSFNVATFVNWMNSNNGFLGASMYWSKPTSYIPEFVFCGNLIDAGTYSSSEYNDELLAWIEEGYHLVLEVSNGSHWVAVDEAMSIQSGTIYIMDSKKNQANADITLESSYSKFHRVHAYKGGATPADMPANAWITSSSDTILAETETITFTYGADYATDYTMAIDREGVGRVSNAEVPAGSFTTSFEYPGIYYVFVTCKNRLGETDTPVLTIHVTCSAEHTVKILEGKDATCTESGLTEGQKCAACDLVLVAQEVIPALGHSYEAVVSDPTCTEAGYSTYTCTRCGDSYVSDPVEALGHRVVVDGAVDAACTESGLTEGSHCADCGEIIVAQEVIPALGHSYEAVVSDPTCTEAGYSTYTCTRCGDSCVSDPVEALGHRVVVDGAVDATCTESGLTEGSHCADCGEIIVAQETIPALGHSMGQWYAETAPTCTETGLRRKDCGRCDHFETEVIAAKGHNYSAVVTSPTCTEAGFTSHTCENCGDSYVDDHTDPKGHSFGQWVTDREPTCTESGSKSRTCACGEIETEQLPALGHDFRNSKCSRCGESNAAQGDVNGDGHVDTTDAKLIMQFDLGIIDASALNLSAADVNGDGNVDTTDAKLIMQLDLGIITEFPKP